MTEIVGSMQQVIDYLVDEVPGITGALVSSADGFVLADRLPEGNLSDVDALGAMSASALALSSRLMKSVGEAPATVTHQRSTDGQVVVIPIAHIAVLTLLATSTADTEHVTLVGRETCSQLQRLFRGSADV
ncbi:MAG: hypothetical protein HKN41_08665 [Ilumatobacter sp.]|nr:hypothetical protein [Ilumatobacter sp.]